MSSPIEALDAIGLGPIERTIAATLARRLGKWTATEALVAAAYAGTRDEPRDPANCLKSVCHALRRKLAPIGLTIEGVPFYGRRMVLESAERSAPAPPRRPPALPLFDKPPQASRKARGKAAPHHKLAADRAPQ